MMTLKEVMQDAFERKVAVGHFNISDSNQLNGIAAAARELSVPVIIGVSEGEAEFVGLKKAVAMVRAAGEEFGINIFINADHAHSVEGCKRAIDAGFDSVIFDGSKLPLVKNIASMKEVVGYANQSGREVMTEGEVGYIGTSSKILDDIPDDVVASVLPTPDNVASYVQETGVTAEIFFCNKEEAQKILNSTSNDMKELLDGVRAFGPTIAVVTDGPTGAFASDGSGYWKMPMYPDPAPPVDRTGAGDSFSSTVVAMLAEGLPLPEALRRGPINSMSVVQYIGAQKGLLNRDQLEKYVEEAPESYKLEEL